MDRLVEAGLVVRRPDPELRRNTLITLTKRGRELFERVVPAHLANERRMLAALSAEEQDALAALLRKLLVEFEGSCAPAYLGVTLAPAHVTIALRESVGLPPVAGLLGRAVDRDGAAAAAGLRTGDVLVAAGERELRSITALAEALDTSRELRVRYVRGTEAHETRVAPAAARVPGRAPRGEHAV
jgi:S1-C subfamily serine protease